MDLFILLWLMRRARFSACVRPCAAPKTKVQDDTASGGQEAWLYMKIGGAGAHRVARRKAGAVRWADCSVVVIACPLGECFQAAQQFAFFLLRTEPILVGSVARARGKPTKFYSTACASLLVNNGFAFGVAAGVRILLRFFRCAFQRW